MLNLHVISAYILFLWFKICFNLRFTMKSVSSANANMACMYFQSLKQKTKPQCYLEFGILLGGILFPLFLNQSNSTKRSCKNSPGDVFI